MNKAFVLATGVLASLAAAAVSTPVGADQPAVVDDAQIQLAKLGITMFSLDTLTEPATECPSVRQDELGYWAGQLGMAATTQGYQVDAYSPETFSAIAVYCGVNPADFVATPDPAAPFAIALEAFNLIDGTFADVIAQADVPATPTPTPDPALGGEVATWCSAANTPGRTICFSYWHRAGLVLDIFMVGPTEGLDETKAQQLLLSMIDNAVTNLAAYNSTLAGTATTVAATPTPAPVSTAAPVSSAPVPTGAPVPTAAPVSTGAPVPTAAPASTVAPLPTVAVPTVAPGPTVPGTPTTLPPGFVRVTDDTATISMAVPATWTDVQTAGLPLDDGTTTPQLIASPDAATFQASFDVPGVSVISAAPIADPQTVLTDNGLTSGCASFATEAYDDGVYSGVAQIGTGCGSTGTGGWRMIVGNTADGTTGVVIQLQTASPADQQAVDTAISTLSVT